MNLDGRQMTNIRGSDTEPWGIPLVIAKGSALKSFPPNKVYSVYFHILSKRSKTENVISFFVSLFLNVDQREAHKTKKTKILPAAKDTHPDRVGPTSASEFFGGSASEWEGRDDQLVSPQGTWCRRVSEEATKR